MHIYRLFIIVLGLWILVDTPVICGDDSTTDSTTTQPNEDILPVRWRYWPWRQQDSNVILAEVLVPPAPPVHPGNDEPSYDTVFRVLADACGTLKHGEQVVVDEKIDPSGGGGGICHRKGTIVLEGIKRSSGSKYDWWGIQTPIGWNAGVVIPREYVPAVEKGLKSLRDTFPKGPVDQLDRAAALQLLQAGDYETWAVGAALLCGGEYPRDLEKLFGYLKNLDTDLPHVLWVCTLVESVPDYGIRVDDELREYMQDHSPQLRDLPRVVRVARKAVTVAPVDQGPDSSPSSVGRTLKPAVRLMGAVFWDTDPDLILARVAAVKSDDGTEGGSLHREFTVLDDLRGHYRPGASLTMKGYATDALRYGIPTLERGTVVLLPVKAGKESESLVYSPGAFWPIGWRAPQLVPAESVQGVQAGLAALRSVLPKNEDDPVDHARALELFNRREYEVWAVGAAMLAT